MDPSAGYSIRGPVPGDVDAIEAMVQAGDLVDEGLADPIADHLRESWNRPRFDLERDAWVVADRLGVIVGYGDVSKEEPHVRLESFGRVHPAHRGRGLGSLLLDRVEHRAAEEAPTTGRVLLQPAIASGDRAAGALLTGRGYAPVRRFWHMEVRLEGAAAPAPPEGVRLRRFDPKRDARAAHALLQDVFADHWGSFPEPFEEWSAWALSETTFDPRLWLLAEGDGELVGVIWGQAMPDHGWISELGVRRSWRGRGIGEVLLRSSFEAFERLGHREVRLNVDAGNESGAIRLYERAGMRVRRRWDLYEKAIGASPWP